MVTLKDPLLLVASYRVKQLQKESKKLGRDLDKLGKKTRKVLDRIEEKQ